MELTDIVGGRVFASCARVPHLRAEAGSDGAGRARMRPPRTLASPGAPDAQSLLTQDRPR